MTDSAEALAPSVSPARFPGGSAFVDGRYIPAEAAAVPISDWGFLHSDATYDVVHVWKGAFFRLEDHLDRFYSGMSSLRMELPYSRSEVRRILHECVRLTGLRDAYVEMICTRGVPATGSRDPRTAKNRFYAFAVPFIWLADPAKQKVGLNMAISPVKRIPPNSVDPRIKNYHWLDLVAGLFDAYDRGAETAILTDTAGNIIEGPGFNVFVLSGSRLSTPASGVLEGVTRRTVMEIAESMELAVQARSVHSGEVSGADEVFATSTAGGVVPITRVDGKPIGTGIPGKVTMAIRDQYWALHEAKQYSTAVSYV